jgi:uncharacterized protein YbbC (DUF1343 family)
MKVLNAIDRVSTEDFGLKGKRLGLITNHSGLTKKLVSTIDMLLIDIQNVDCRFFT